MPNKLFSIFIFFMVAVTSVFPQSIVIRPESGVGTFMMKDLKALQTASLPDLGVNIESYSKFPPYSGYGISLVYYFKSGFGAGINADFYSTGATNNYHDYSGWYKFNQLTHAYNFGTVISYKHLTYKHLSCYIELGEGLKISQLSLIEDFSVFSYQIISDDFHFENTSLWIKPVYRCEYRIFNFLSAGAYAGAELNFKKKLHLKDTYDAVLINGGKDVTIDWTGLRVGLYLSVSIPIVKNNQADDL